MLAQQLACVTSVHFDTVIDQDRYAENIFAVCAVLKVGARPRAALKSDLGLTCLSGIRDTSQLVAQQLA